MDRREFAYRLAGPDRFRRGLPYVSEVRWDVDRVEVFDDGDPDPIASFVGVEAVRRLRVQDAYATPPSGAVVELVATSVGHRDWELQRLWRIGGGPSHSQRRFILLGHDDILIVDANGLRGPGGVAHRVRRRRELPPLSRRECLTYDQAFVMPTAEVIGVHWVGRNLRGRSFTGVRFDHMRAVRCQFDGSSMAFAAFRGSEFINCTFVEVDFWAAAIGVSNRQPTIFRDCLFRGADFRAFPGFVFGHVRFESCEFQDLKGRFVASNVEFVDCRFTGSVPGRFLGARMSAFERDHLAGRRGTRSIPGWMLRPTSLVRSDFGGAVFENRPFDSEVALADVVLPEGASEIDLRT